MNKVALLLIPFFLVTSFYKEIITGDDYTLTITNGKIIKETGKTFLEIPVTLTNKTGEKLNYGSMSCSWQDFYSVDNSKLRIETNDCDKNVELVLSLAPSQSKTVFLRIEILNKNKKNAVKFKIGFNLFIVKDNKDTLPLFYRDENAIKNIIWSNEITMP